MSKKGWLANSNYEGITKGFIFKGLGKLNLRRVSASSEALDDTENENVKS